MAKEKQSMNNFGIGWGTILYCLLMFFLYVGMINDGTNVLAPAAAANCGVEPGTIITKNRTEINICYLSYYFRCDIHWLR